MEKKETRELILPKWMISGVEQYKRHKREFGNDKKIIKAKILKPIDKRGSKKRKLNIDIDEVKEQFSVHRNADINPLVGNINYCECAEGCERILNLLDNREDLTLGLELDWHVFITCPRTSNIHICYGTKQCYLFNVESMNLLPLACKQLFNHGKVKFVGHKIITDLLKLGRDFNFNTKNIIENKVIIHPENIHLSCQHGWLYSTVDKQNIENSLAPTANEYNELKFKGKVHFITNFQECAEACHKLLILAEEATSELVLGFDQEWPLTKKGCGKVALMQICLNENECFLFHLSNFVSLPLVLVHLLEHKRIKITGLNIEGDIRKLGRDFKIDVYNIMSNNVIELSKLANDILNCYERWSLAGLVLNQMGLVLCKDPKVRISNWNDINLNNNQLTYAATDAYVRIVDSLFNTK